MLPAHGLQPQWPSSATVDHTGGVSADTTKTVSAGKKYHNHHRGLVYKLKKTKRKAIMQRALLTALTNATIVPRAPKLDPKTHLTNLLHFPGASILEQFISLEVEQQLLDASWTLVAPSPHGGRWTAQYGWVVNLARPKAPLSPPTAGYTMSDMPHCLYAICERISSDFAIPNALHDAFHQQVFQQP